MLVMLHRKTALMLLTAAPILAVAAIPHEPVKRTAAAGVYICPTTGFASGCWWQLPPVTSPCLTMTIPLGWSFGPDNGLLCSLHVDKNCLEAKVDIANPGYADFPGISTGGLDTNQAALGWSCVDD